MKLYCILLLWIIQKNHSIMFKKKKKKIVNNDYWYNFYFYTNVFLQGHFYYFVYFTVLSIIYFKSSYSGNNGIYFGLKHDTIQHLTSICNYRVWVCIYGSATMCMDSTFYLFKWITYNYYRYHADMHLKRRSLITTIKKKKKHLFILKSLETLK